MPKLKVYEESTKTEKVVTLRLVQQGNQIDLITLDGDGFHDNTLFTFAEDGSIERHESVDVDYGFNLDSDGRIQFDDEL